MVSVVVVENPRLTLKTEKKEALADAVTWLVSEEYYLTKLDRTWSSCERAAPTSMLVMTCVPKSLTKS